MANELKRLTRRLAIKIGAVVSGSTAVAATGLANWLTGCSDDTTGGGNGGAGGNGTSSDQSSSSGTASSGYGGAGGYGYGAFRPAWFNRFRARV